MKTRKKRGKTGGKWARYGLKRVNKEGRGGITWGYDTLGPPMTLYFMLFVAPQLVADCRNMWLGIDPLGTEV